MYLRKHNINHLQSKTYLFGNQLMHYMQQHCIVDITLVIEYISYTEHYNALFSARFPRKKLNRKECGGLALAAVDTVA